MKAMTILAAMMLPFLAQAQEPVDSTDARVVAEAFARAYESGDPCATALVLFEGFHVSQMGGTVEELRDDLFPKELKKNAKKPAGVEMLETSFEENSEDYKHPVWFAVYSARDKKHTLCLHKVGDAWKVDISYLWMGDWYDWMPGY